MKVNFATLRLNASRAVKRARVCLPLSPLYATDNKQTVLHCICTCHWCTARRHRSGANQSHEAGIDTQQQRKPQKQVGTMVSTQLPSIQAAVRLSQNTNQSSTGGCNTITCVDQKTARAAWSKLKPWAVPGMDNQTPTEGKCTAQFLTCRSQTPHVCKTLGAPWAVRAPGTWHSGVVVLSLSRSEWDRRSCSAPMAKTEMDPLKFTSVYS